MKYLMVDLHQRFLGSITQEPPLAVGDTFATPNRSYTVVGIQLAREPDVRSVTVIAANGRARAAKQS
jgi:hypothetical protein